jgi:hypothetical protein
VSLRFPLVSVRATQRSLDHRGIALLLENALAKDRQFSSNRVPEGQAMLDSFRSHIEERRFRVILGTYFFVCGVRTQKSPANYSAGLDDLVSISLN